MKEDGISFEKARSDVDDFIDDAAAFHFYLGALWNETIMPHLDHISPDSRNEIATRMSDLKDILDPDGYIPQFFLNGNFLEYWTRIQMIDK